MKAGDDIYLRRGDVWSSMDRRMEISLSGTEENYVTVGAYGSGPKPVLTHPSLQAIYTQSPLHHVIIENLHIKDIPHRSIDISNNAGNPLKQSLVFRNLLIENSSSSGITLWNTQNVLIDGCIFDNMNSGHGISIQASASLENSCANMIIRNSWINNSKDGISLHYAGTNETHSLGDNFYIDNVTIANTWEEVIDVVGGRYADNVLIRNSDLSKGQHISTGHGHSNIFVENSRIHDMPRTSHVAGGANNVRFRNNIIDGWGRQALVQNQNQWAPYDFSGLYYYNNHLIGGSMERYYIQINNNDIKNWNVKNNIFYSTLHFPQHFRIHRHGRGGDPFFGRC